MFRWSAHEQFSVLDAVIGEGTAQRSLLEPQPYGYMVVRLPSGNSNLQLTRGSNSEISKLLATSLRIQVGAVWSWS